MLIVAKDLKVYLRASISSELFFESVITYEGTETIQELIVGRELTGHPAF